MAHGFKNKLTQLLRVIPRVVCPAARKVSNCEGFVVVLIEWFGPLFNDCKQGPCTGFVWKALVPAGSFALCCSMFRAGWRVLCGRDLFLRLDIRALQGFIVFVPW